MPRQVWIAGASGLVGGELLRLTAADNRFETVTALVRKPLKTVPDRVQQLQVDFDQLARTRLPRPELVFCALGTTIRTAGSQAAFRKVDHDYVLSLARVALALGAQHFCVVSALGADPASRVFYNRVKGQMEQSLAALGLPRLSIVRPSLLLGRRKEFRLGERVAALFGPLTPARYKPIEASAVAQAMCHLALADRAGRLIVENDELHRLVPAR